MRGIQCFVFCALLYSIQVDAFGSCDVDGDCPDNAECNDGGGHGGGSSECECKEGFDEIDLPDITIDGKAATVCIGMKQSIDQ